jgi:hypothetical protein
VGSFTTSTSMRGGTIFKWDMTASFLILIHLPHVANTYPLTPSSYLLISFDAIHFVSLSRHILQDGFWISKYAKRSPYKHASCGPFIESYGLFQLTLPEFNGLCIRRKQTKELLPTILFLLSCRCSKWPPRSQTAQVCPKRQLANVRR